MRAKMTGEERAKQFMPFAALKGFEESLRAVEKIVVEKKELTEDKKQELDEIFAELDVRDMVNIIYYDKDCYLKKSGMVSKIDIDSGFIKVVNTKIRFEDIYDIVKVANRI